MVYVLTLAVRRFTGTEINDLAALRRQGYGLFAAKIGFRSHNNFCDLNHKMAVLNHNLAADDNDDNDPPSGG